MATNEVDPGPVARRVIDNVKRLRREQGLSLVALSTRLTELGHTIAASGIQRIESGKRRVDPDDLVALAAALDVAPVTLLAPRSIAGDVAVTDTVKVDGAALWSWLRADHPLFEVDDEASLLSFAQRAKPLEAQARPYMPDADTEALLDDLARQLNELRGRQA